MKPLQVLTLGTLLLVSACVPKPSAPPPQPEQTPPPAPPPAPPPPPPAAADWRDLPLTAGDWFYREAGARFEAIYGPSETQPVLIFGCDRAPPSVRLVRNGTTTGNTMTVRTSTAARNFSLSIDASGSPFATIPANDRFLDAMVFSRGRFTVEVPGTPMLVIPAWPEPARVLEECRL